VTAAVRRRTWVPYVLVAPAGTFVAVFAVAPVVLVVGLAFTDLDLVRGTAGFVGFANVAAELTNPGFAQVLGNTALYALYTVPVSMTVGLLVALTIDGLAAGKAFWRVVYFLPVASTLVAMSAVWRWIFAETDWLSSPTLALVAVAVVGNWHQIGFVVVVYLAALGNVSQPELDAARLDGARAWSRFWHVTWPALGPATLFALLATIAQALQLYDVVVTLTGGGPIGATTTLTYEIWSRGVRYFDVGRAAVLALVLLALSLLVTAVQRGAGGRLERAGSR
jgi:multiple sugar transport system permease protein